MKPIVFAISALLLASSALCLATVSDPAKHLAEAALEAETVKIKFYSPAGMEEVTFTDPAWVAQLSAVLGGATYSPRSHCLCISYPQIYLRQKNGKSGVLSVHHGENLRSHIDAVSGDFFVGEAAGRAILDLANKKKTR